MSSFANNYYNLTQGKGGLISERFSLLLQSLKKVPNHSPEHYSPKKEVAQGCDLTLFLETGAKLKKNSEIKPPLT